MGKSNRIRANRAQAKLSSSVAQKNQKKSMPSWLVSTIAIAITAIILLTVVLGMLSSNGVFMRYRDALESEHYTVSGNMITYLYQQQYQGFVSQYSTYLQNGTFSLDTTKSPKNQTFGDATKGGYEATYLGEFTGTWFDYFMSLAKAQASELLVFSEEAYARGLSLDDADKTAVAAQIAQLEATALQSGYSISQYIAMMYGTGVKVSDVEEMMELTAIAQKGLSAVQADIEAMLTDEAIRAEYEANVLKYDVVGYNYFTESVKYEDVAKELLGSDYTADELAQEKEKVDAKYAEKIAAIKLKQEKLEAMTDAGEFLDFVVTDKTVANYDTLFAKLELKAEDTPADDVLASIKTTLLDKVIAEYKEGKTTTVGDSVKTAGTDGAEDTYTVYDHSVTKTFAEKIDSLKVSLFNVAVTAKTSNAPNKVVHQENNEVSKWAFDDAREVGDKKTVKDEKDDANEKSFTVSVYFLTAKKHADEELAKNVSYILLSSADSAKKIIETFKAGEITLERFEQIAKDQANTTANKAENYQKGSFGIDAFDAWLYSDTTKVGSFTETPIVDSTVNVVAYYYEDGKAMWKISVENALFEKNYTARVEEMTAKYAVTINDSVIADVNA